MLDFYKISEKIEGGKNISNQELVIYPNFLVKRSNDLIVQGGAFKAIWDEENHIWSEDFNRCIQIIDKDLQEYTNKRMETALQDVKTLYMYNYKSKVVEEFIKYMRITPAADIIFDLDIRFKDDVLRKEDYATKRLPYSLVDCSIKSYDEMMNVLYEPEEREKIEWAIGSIFNGASKHIQKFYVFYGPPGSGKSTVLNVIQQLFDGYYSVFESDELTSRGSQFSMSYFVTNPLVSIQHDGDFSRIEKNTRLNSIVSHETMIINEKFKNPYSLRLNTTLFTGTNKPVQITDAKSGLLRRLIDIRPSGEKLSIEKYNEIMYNIPFELGGIAKHCIRVFEERGADYYNHYQPTLMMEATDSFYNFVEDSYFVFKDEDPMQLKKAWDMYKVYCEDAKLLYPLNKQKFKLELSNYYQRFSPRRNVGSHGTMRNVYEGFLTSKFVGNPESKSEVELDVYSIELKEQVSIFDTVCANSKAQLANSKGTPNYKWENVQTVLKDINTKELHYVKPEENHIVIDFDLKNVDGVKSLEKNLKEASKFPATYTEVSKSGCALHLHYIYDGDVESLSNVYSDGIEIKTFLGGASLRRKLTLCNNKEIAHINSGLPVKEKREVINFEGVKSESKLRELIARNLRKEIHPGTKPSIDFIFKILEDAYNSELIYDVSDMKQGVLNFALCSTNHAKECANLVGEMKFISKEPEQVSHNTNKSYISDELTFFDVEVFPNLFLVVFKQEGDDKNPVTLINPTSKDIEKLLRYKLVGFNNRRYDNHILYAAYLGYSVEQIYNTSKNIISGNRNALFREAYNLSYADIYDFSSKKQGLKKFEIELGIHHQELGLPWDEPVDQSLWEKVAEYCVNDVVATEAVFHSKGRVADWHARLILSELSGLTPNDTTQNHAARIIFGEDKHPQSKFVYTDLSELFPGYTYDNGVSMYLGEVVGEGGRIMSEPGIYSNTALLDVTSMHPTSAILLNLFGDYTINFKELVEARVAIKRHDYDSASKMLGGVLTSYLGDDESADALAYALKIVINIVYGLTSAGFDNKFRDKRNIDNIVAKRGALFMMTLEKAISDRGHPKLVHVKTDSVKVVYYTKDDLDFIVKFGKQYGYNFELEAEYDKLVLMNDSTYAARYPNGKWVSTGTQLIHPYVFKRLFSDEEIELSDLVETRNTTKGSIYLAFEQNDGRLDYRFIGNTGAFYPVKKEYGGQLFRGVKAEVDGEYDKYYAINGTKGYFWQEVEAIDSANAWDMLDMTYFENLSMAAIDDINALPSEYTYDWLKDA